jgi:hypothetical protein
MIRSLNNFPDNVCEVSGKRLLAISVAFLVLGSGIGASIMQKAAAQMAVVQQAAQGEQITPARLQPTIIRPVYQEWKYPGANIADIADDYDTLSVMTTADSIDCVRAYYMTRFGYDAKFIALQSDPKMSVEQKNNAHGAFLVRPTPTGNDACSMRTTEGEHPSVSFTASETALENGHFFKIILQPQGRGTRITLHLTGLPK